ncbi:MAG: hypothetical protein EBZ99_04695 [Actinobacteria bacterium]|nr:hypothetical protein [Actinomycetota bacterium]
MRNSGKWWRITTSAKGDRALFCRHATAIFTWETLAAWEFAPSGVDWPSTGCAWVAWAERAGSNQVFQITL